MSDNAINGYDIEPHIAEIYDQVENHTDDVQLLRRQVNPRDSKAFVIARGNKAILRDRLPSDVDDFIRWQTHGEWREYDAPWEAVSTMLTEEDQEQIRAKFLAQCAQDQPWPRHRVAIATPENKPPRSWGSFTKARRGS